MANAHLDKIFKHSQVKPNDHAGLWDLARDMKRCGMVLSQMEYLADVNSSETLLKIQQLLPIHLQAEWARRAHTMIVRCIVPTFELMTTFIEDSGQLASNIFGRNIGKAFPKNDKAVKNKTGSKGTTFATQRVKRTHNAQPKVDLIIVPKGNALVAKKSTISGLVNPLRRKQ